MLKALKFVQGAVSKKDTVPALTHFAIENGQVRGFNGVIGLCSPIPCDVKCKPKATTLVKAIQGCKEIPQLTLLKSNKLQVKSGKFKVSIDCLDDVAPFIVPTGTSYQIDAKLLLNAVRLLVPVVTTNNRPERTWANGIRFDNGSAFATNNVILVQYWTNSVFAKPITIPLVCLEELLRIGEEPTHVQISDTSVTFHYEGDRWLYSALIPAEWPDISKIIENPSVQSPLPENFYEALEAIQPFAKERWVYFMQDKITTDETGEGGEYEIPDFKGSGCYDVSMFLLLEKLVKTIDLSLYPKPALFFGDGLRGAIVGRSV